MITIEKLKELPANAIFASGTDFIEHPWFNEATLSTYSLVDGEYGKDKDGIYTKVNWVAVRGNIHDWAIYHSLDANLENAYYLDGESHLLIDNQGIADHGAKLRNEDEIKRLVPCDEDVFKMYRY